MGRAYPGADSRITSWQVRHAILPTNPRQTGGEPVRGLEIRRAVYMRYVVTCVSGGEHPCNTPSGANPEPAIKLESK